MTSLLEAIINFFKPKETVASLQRKKELIEARKSEAQLRLERERNKPNPDIMRIDGHEREMAAWDKMLEKLDKKIEMKQYEI